MTHSIYHPLTLNVQHLLFQMHLFVYADKPQTLRNGSGFARGSGPSQEFFLDVNVTEIQRLNSWLHGSLFCSSLALQRGCKASPRSQLNLFSDTERSTIKTRLFPLEKWVPFCSRNECTVMKFYDSLKKHIIGLSQNMKKPSTSSTLMLPQKNCSQV